MQREALGMKFNKQVGYGLALCLCAARTCLCRLINTQNRALRASSAHLSVAAPPGTVLGVIANRLSRDRRGTLISVKRLSLIMSLQKQKNRKDKFATLLLILSNTLFIFLCPVSPWGEGGGGG